jgi:hypothetical protein
VQEVENFKPASKPLNPVQSITLCAVLYSPVKVLVGIYKRASNDNNGMYAVVCLQRHGSLRRAVWDSIKCDSKMLGLPF